MSGTRNRRGALGAALGFAASGLIPKAEAQTATPGTNYAPFDDAGNASGLGAPAILRGTISTYNMAGLVLGAGQTTGVRQTNATTLQSAFNYASAHGKFLEMVEGVYEISSSTGLVVPTNSNGDPGFTLRGSHSGTIINQFYTTGSGAPILTIGDTTGVNSISEFDISGLTLNFGVSVTGLTNATPIRIASASYGNLEKIFCNSFTNASYNGMEVSQNVWSCTFKDINIAFFQNHGLYLNNGGSTGNVWSNIYLAGGPGNTTTPTAISGSFIYTNDAIQDQYFERLNCEWAACNTVISLGDPQRLFFSGEGWVFDALHIEGIALTGADPVILGLGGNATVLVNGFDLVTTFVKSANFTGKAHVARMTNEDGGASKITIKDLNMVSFAASEVNTAIDMIGFVFDGYSWDDQSIFEIDGGTFRDDAGGNYSGHVSFDTKLPTASFALPARYRKYTYGYIGSIVDQPVLTISSTYTLYGQYQNVTVQVPASITSFTLTLASVMGATGNQAVPTGATVRVHRKTGTASGTLTIKNGAGTTLNTNTTADTNFFYVFNGTNFTAVTPVTT